MEQELRRRLSSVGVDPTHFADPSAAWHLLYERYGKEMTVIDRYALEAHTRGIAVEELPVETKSKITAEVLASQFPGIELIGEPSGHPVEVVPYDARWPKVFQHWRADLEAELGSAAVTIHHVGSTSVPGLAAKPIIDINVGVADLAAESEYRHAIERLGVRMRSRDSEHRYFRPAAADPRVVQVHVCEAFGQWAVDHVLFRDYLRTFSHTRDEYAALKLELAATYHNDRIAYTDAKSAFILRTLAAAHAWADTTDWALGID